VNFGSRSASLRGGGAAARTNAPVQDLRTVNQVAALDSDVEDRLLSRGFIHVCDRSAGPADGMIVLIANPGIKERRRTRRLETPDEALLGEQTKCVVHRLSRDCPDIGSHRVCDGLR
jgi:hypothetical protein